MCFCVRICTCEHTWICICVWMHVMCVNAHVHLCARACLCVHVCTRMCGCEITHCQGLDLPRMSSHDLCADHLDPTLVHLLGLRPSPSPGYQQTPLLTEPVAFLRAPRKLRPRGARVCSGARVFPDLRRVRGVRGCGKHLLLSRPPHHSHAPRAPVHTPGEWGDTAPRQRPVGGGHRGGGWQPAIFRTRRPAGAIGGDGCLWHPDFQATPLKLRATGHGPGPQSARPASPGWARPPACRARGPHRWPLHGSLEAGLIKVIGIAYSTPDVHHKYNVAYVMLCHHGMVVIIHYYPQ